MTNTSTKSEESFDVNDDYMELCLKLFAGRAEGHRVKVENSVGRVETV